MDNLKNEKNCDTCKHYNTYFDCSQCSDFDEWEASEGYKKLTLKHILETDYLPNFDEQKEDLIHNPKHYIYSNHEPIDVIKAWNLDFDLGNVVKYIARCEHKGDKLQDLHKALEYLQHEIKCLEGKPCN